MKQIRCLNIDWLEVYCQEPFETPLDACYFIDKGYQVKIREYGTPIYREMFFIIDEGHQFMEVRRAPRAPKSRGGVSDDRACHLRFTNRSCYLRNPVQIMCEFLLAHGYIYKSLSRIDICLDFQQFDNGISPVDFVNRYMTGEYQKLNQANVSAHGQDAWLCRTWNSFKWGAPTSAVTTKFYNKTMELKHVKDKPYIREIWSFCGFSEDKDVWRVEFSITSQSNAVLNKSTGEFIKSSLTSFSDKQRQWFQFCVFASKYFHFKEREFTKSGKVKPKGRCKDVPTFVFSGDCLFYTPTRLTWIPEGGRTEKMLARRLDAIRFDDTLTPHVREAASFLYGHMVERYNILAYCKNLEVALLANAKTAPEFYRDFTLLEDIQKRWDLPDVRPRRV